MSNGKIYVVGIGPGKKENMTFRAYEAMENSDIIVGYKTYVDLVKEYYPGKDEKLRNDKGSGQMYRSAGTGKTGKNSQPYKQR